MTIRTASLGIKICQSFLAFYGDWKEDDPDLDSAYGSVEDLCRTLVLLLDFLKKEDRDIFTKQTQPPHEYLFQAQECVERCEGALFKLQKKLRKLQRSPSQPTILAKARRVLSPSHVKTLTKMKKLADEVRSRLSTVTDLLGLDIDNVSVAELLQMKVDSAATTEQPIVGAMTRSTVGQQEALPNQSSSLQSSAATVGAMSDRVSQESSQFAIELHKNINIHVAEGVDFGKTRKAVGVALAVFSYTLRPRATSPIQTKATTLIAEESFGIAKILLQKISPPVPDAKKPSTFSMLGDAVDWTRRNAKSATTKKANLASSGVASVKGEFEDDGQARDEFTSHTLPFLIDNEVFIWLVKRIQALLVQTRGGDFDSLSNRLIGCLPKEYPSDATPVGEFDVDWDLIRYLEANYDKIPDLTTVIVITADMGNVQVNTTGEYIRKTWPVTGPQFMQALATWVMSYHEESTRQFTLPITGGTVEISRRQSHLFVRVSSLIFVIVEIGEQLAWLGCACRAGDSLDRQAVARSRLSLKSKHSQSPEHIVFDISFVMTNTTERAADSGQCWRRLFSNICVAEGFPISTRQRQEQGLEISFEMMARLSGAHHLTAFRSELLLIGFQTLFVPIRTTDLSIVWHLLMTTNGESINYAARYQLPNRCRITDFESVADLERVERSRHFLGWVANASQHAGTADADYSANRATQVHRKRRGLTFGPLSIGFSKTVTFTASIGLGGQSKTIHTSENDCLFVDTVEKMTQIHVLLYDKSHERGWLIDGASAVLHLLRFYVDRYQPIIDEATFQIGSFRYATSTIGPNAAKAVLLNSGFRDTVLQDERRINEGDSAKGKMTVEKKVTELYGILRDMKKDLEDVKNASQVPIHGPNRQLEGWKFQDIVEGKSDIPRVASRLHWRARGWHRFIRHIEAVVLFGDGFGEIIRASDQVCPSLGQAPVGRSCLTVPMSVLKRIHRDNGSPKSIPIEFAPHTYWGFNITLFSASAATKHLQRAPFAAEFKN